jgi:hypothetical protein
MRPVFVAVPIALALARAAPADDVPRTLDERLAVGEALP